MAIRLIEGFDHFATGDLPGKQWFYFNRSGHFSLVTGRLGGQALQAVNSDGGQYIYKDLPGNFTAGVIGFAFKTGTPTTTTTVLYLANGPFGQIGMDVTSGSTLQFNSATSTAAAPYPLGSGVWYYVEIKFTVASSAGANTCQIYIDGALYLTMSTGQSASLTGATTINRVIIDVGSSFNGACTYDDMYFIDIDSDTTGPLGECRVETLLPTGAGANTNWSHTGGSSNWASVANSTPDGDTTYVSTATVNTVDSYVLADLSSAPTTIHGLQVNNWSRKDDVAARSIQAAVVISSTTYTGGDKSLRSDYSDQTTVFRKSPASAGAWTASEVNGMEVGVKLSV